jgi:hypothetical protein
MFRRLIASLLIISFIMPAHAGMVGTESLLERERITNLLERAEVQAQLQAFGVSPADVKARVAALSDPEVADLAARIDNQPAGGASILGVALIVFLVLLLTDILGYTKVFPFTKPMK